MGGLLSKRADDRKEDFLSSYQKIQKLTPRLNRLGESIEASSSSHGHRVRGVPENRLSYVQSRLGPTKMLEDIHSSLPCTDKVKRLAAEYKTITSVRVHPRFSVFALIYPLLLYGRPFQGGNLGFACLFYHESVDMCPSSASYYMFRFSLLACVGSCKLWLEAVNGLYVFTNFYSSEATVGDIFEESFSWKPVQKLHKYEHIHTSSEIGEIAKKLATKYKKTSTRVHPHYSVIFRMFKKVDRTEKFQLMNSIEDLFCDIDHRFTQVVLSSADEMKKTNLCQYITSCWCEAHFPELKTPENFLKCDIEFMREFDYVFKISKGDIKLGDYFKTPQQAIYKWMSKKSLYKGNESELYSILEEAKCLIIFQVDGHLSDYSHTSHRWNERAFFLGTAKLPKTLEQFGSHKISIDTCLEHYFELSDDEQLGNNTIYSYLRRYKFERGLTSLKINGIEELKETGFAYSQTDFLNILTLDHYQQISVSSLHLIHSEITTLLNYIATNVQLHAINLSKITCLNHGQKCRGLHLNLAENSQLFKIAITSTPVERLICNMTNRRLLIVTSSSLQGLAITFSNRNHVFFPDHISSLASVFENSPALPSVTLSDMKIGEQKIPDIKFRKEDFKHIVCLQENDKHEEIVNICSSLLYRLCMEQTIKFCVTDFQEERKKEGSFADSIILNLLACQLLSSHEEVVEVIPSVIEESKEPTLICVVKTEMHIQQYRGFSVKNVPMHFMSKESIITENSIDKNTEKYMSVLVDNIVDINEVISYHADKLLSEHSNIEAIRASFVKQGQSAIVQNCPCVVLYCRVKGAVPYNEKPFPEKLFHPKKNLSYPTDIREGYFSFCSGGPDWHQRLAMGCSVGEMNKTVAGTVGPFVNVVETNELCFLTAKHIFQPPYSRAGHQVIGAKVFQPADYHLPAQPTYRSPDRECGEVVACVLDQETDAALVKIKADRKPERGLFVDIAQGDLLSAGLGANHIPAFDTGEIMEVSGLTIRDNVCRPILKIGVTTGLTKGFLSTTEGTVTESKYCTPMESTYNGRIERHFMKGQIFVDSLVKRMFCQGGDSGAAVFLLDSNLHLLCIGILLGTMSDGTAVVTPIKKVLQSLGQSYNQRTLVLNNFTLENMNTSE